MLVLTRKRSEVIQIGDQIVLKVLRTGRSTVKIGIDAPGNVRIFRGELTNCEGSTTLKSLLEERKLTRRPAADTAGRVQNDDIAPAAPVAVAIAHPADTL